MSLGVALASPCPISSDCLGRGPTSQTRPKPTLVELGRGNSLQRMVGQIGAQVGCTDTDSPSPEPFSKLLGKCRFNPSSRSSRAALHAEFGDKPQMVERGRPESRNFSVRRRALRVARRVLGFAFHQLKHISRSTGGQELSNYLGFFDVQESPSLTASGRFRPLVAFCRARAQAG